MEEMEERMRNMERMYLKRITDEVEMNERKMDAKIDMLHRTGLLGSEEVTEEEDDYVSNISTLSGRDRSLCHRVKKRITSLITCPRTMSTIMRNAPPRLWIASLPWIGHRNCPQV